MLERILPHVSYLRFNFSGGERNRYKQIMGLKDRDYDQVIQNVKDAMEIKRKHNLSVEREHPDGPDAGHGRPDHAVRELGEDCGPTTRSSSTAPTAPTGRSTSTTANTARCFRCCKDEELSDDTFRVAVKWSRSRTRASATTRAASDLLFFFR